MRGYIKTFIFTTYIIATCSQTFSQINATFNEENFTILSPANIYNSILFSSPEHNFDYSDLAWAGDLDGDGYDDAYFNAGYCADERTGDEYDRVDKSYVVFGGDDLQSLNTLLLYYTIYPVGDINGDNRDDLMAVGIDGNFRILYGNNQTGLNTGSKIFDPTVLWGEDTGLPTEIDGFCDFNGDGYGDIALALSTDNITIIYGALFDNMLSSAQYTINYRMGVRENKVTTGTFDNIPTRILSICVEEGNLTNGDPNDDQEIVFEMFNLSSGSPVLEETFILSTAVESTSIITSAFYIENYGALDITGDGINEWIFGKDNTQVSFLSLDSSLEWGGDLCDSSYFGVLKNIGDLNGDGREDFIWEDNDIGFTDETQSIIFGNPIDDITTCVGDLNGDGFDDICALSADTQETGYVLTSSNNSSVLTESPRFLNVPLSERLVTMTQNTGDFDGDGIDDFIYYNNDSLWLYLAGPESTPLAAKLTTKESERINKIIAADFNGDGFEDIIVVARNSEFYETAYIDSCKIHFFMGSSVPDLAADYSFDSDIWISSLETHFELSLDDIGDINDDDKDDLVLSVSSDKTMFKIIYGSNDPENAQNFSRSIPIESNYHVTGRAESVGDLNSDSIDDFVLGCVNFDQNRSGDETGVFVYFGDGKDETAGSYDFPDLLINEEIPDGYVKYLGINIMPGDYNGDGINDIAVLPWGIYKSTGDTDPDGYNILYLYYGGRDMDYLSDVKLNLPHRLFGVDTDGYIDRFQGEINTVPDINDDGCDELFLSNRFTYNSTNPNFSQKYSAILMGGSTLESGLITGFNLEGYSSIGSSVNGYFYSDFNSAVGDFDGDGDIELLARCSDGNYQGTSIYEYHLKTLPANIINPDIVRSLLVYPNPAKDYINLDFGELNGLVHVDIYSSSGRRIFSKEINGSEKISINHLEEGGYIITAKYQNQLFSSKLVIAK